MSSATLRPLTPADAETVAELHTISWQSAYRGILTDAYLDNAVGDERRVAWREKLAALTADEFGLLAVREARVIGFTFVRLRDDPVWGALIDNLHVHPDFKGNGIGQQLMTAVALEVARRDPSSGIHLWVFDANTPSRAFYSAMGGEHVQHVIKAAPDGQDLPEWRVAWPTPDAVRLRGR